MNIVILLVSLVAYDVLLHLAVLHFVLLDSFPMPRRSVKQSTGKKGGI